MDKKKLSFLILFTGLFILISGIYLGSDFITRMTMGYQQKGFTPLQRILTQMRVVIFYLSLLVYPHPSRLNLDHDFAVSYSLFSPFTTFLSLLFLIGSIALTIFLMRRNRLVSYAILWFFGNLVIESSITLCLSLPKREWEKWVTGLIILFTMLFSYWTYERASVWRGPFSLWMDAVKKSPHKTRPHNALGHAYEYNKGMLDEAISEYKKALAINPNYYKAHNNLGVAYARKGRLDEAISEYKKTLAIKPSFVEAYNNLGVAYARKGRLDEAISEYKRVLILKPRYAETYYNLGNAYDKMNSFDKAIAKYKRALILNPQYADAHNNLGATYIKKGMFDEAIAEYKQALAIKPRHTRAHYNLGTAYLKKGDLDKAISVYKQAIVIKPAYAEAHNNLAVAYYSKRNYRLAIIHCDKAVELGGKVNPKLLKLLKPHR
jgi:tetratricopeptide (TPR) repeat protein